MIRRATLLAVALLAAIAVWVAWRTLGPASPKVLLVGVDGADPAILERLMREGRLPAFARLVREGAFARLRSREPLLSPVLWTTIATGRPGQDHGVLDFVERARDGRIVTITSSRRRVPALWNIASSHGVSSGFIGWYASFPAEPVRGFAVSDRLAFHQVRSDRVARGSTYPSELAEQLQAAFGLPAPATDEVRKQFVPGAQTPLTADGGRRLDQLARMVATADYYRAITPWLLRTYRPALLGVYFELIDACGHLFMEDAPPRRTGVSSEDFAAFSGTVDRCYEYQDAALADLLDSVGPETLTIVVSDHGFKSGERRPDSGGRVDVGLAPLWHLPNGIVVLHGPDVRSGSTIRDATILDIAPTVLQALGIPIARDLRGRPIREPFSRGPLTRAPDLTDRYVWAPVPPPAPEDADVPERLEELKALGYVSGSAGTIPHDADGRTATSYLNEGISLAVDGEGRDALRAFERAAAIDPPNVNARAFAARVHLQRRDYRAAGALLDAAVALDPRSVYVRLLRANLALSTRNLDQAAAELDAAASLDARLPMLYIQRARLLNARDDAAGALAALATAESLTDTEALLLDILVLRDDVARRAGRIAEAEAAVARAAQLAPPDRLAAARAEAALGRGDAPAAIAHLERAVAADPRSAPLWTMLGAAYGSAARYEPAIDAYERAIALAPSALACKTLAALVLESRGDRDRAVQLWRQSLDLDPNQPDVRQFLETYAPGR